MPRQQGQVLERDCKSGRRYALRLVAYGRRRYVTLGGAIDGWTEQRAHAELARILDEVGRGDWTPPPRNLPFHPASSATRETTLGVFARRWLTARRAEVASSTHAYERWALELHLLPYFANVPLAKLTIRDVDAYRQHKVQEAARRRLAATTNRPERDRRGQPRRPMSASSINKTIDVLQAVLELAREYDLIATNPGRGRRRRLKVTHPPAIYLDRFEHIQALLDAATDLDQSPRWLCTDRHAILATLMLAGLRVNELCHLQWSDIDLDRHRIRIRRSKTRAGCREIMILPLLHRALATHHTRVGQPVASGLVFPTRTGTLRQPANLRNQTLAHANAAPTRRSRPPACRRYPPA